MGEVYRARDTRLDRTVAIKILPEHLSSNPEAKQRLDREG
jgi:eukaryotic-like serine/threonine-protein kinase